MIVIRNYLKVNALALCISLLFALVFSALVFFNHYCFRTFALDLGVYTNALYDYSCFQWNDASTFKEIPRNLLSDHLDLSLFLIAPFSLFLGQYTLLIFQILFVLIGGMGVYHLIELYTNKKRLAIYAIINFYLFFGIYSALSFDYHSNVLAAMMIPWLIFSLKKNQYIKFSGLFLLILISKESMSLWLFTICLGLLLEFWRLKRARILLLVFMAIALIYFVIALKVVMPYFSPDGQYSNFKYSILGEDYLDAFLNSLKHPFETIKLLFINHSDNAKYDWVKMEFYVFVLLSGAYFLIRKPAYFLMLLMPLLAKMTYDDPAIWSIDCHYSIEFAPIIGITAFLVIHEIKNSRTQKFFIVILLLGSLTASIRLMDNTVYWHDYSRMRIYQKQHYTKSYDISKINSYFKLIPDTSIVSVQSPLLPHLAYRDKCYQLPIVKDAEYIVASKSEQITYPIKMNEMIQLLNDSIQSTRWDVVVNDSEISILKRKSLP
ncbi:MAG: DUF2079 domain-containing protein [Bacteroidia bacterium]